MSTKFIIPSSTPDTVGRYAVTPGTPDQVIELPTVGGTVTLNSQIEGGDDLLNATASFALTASYALSGPGGGGTEGGLSGTQYLYVSANGTDTQNATELQAAYDAAKLLSPTGTNRITIVCGPGNYNFGSSIFTMDTEYIDLVSLDGNRSVVFNAPRGSNPWIEGSISITANDVFVKGIDVQDKNFTIATDLNLLRVENCIGGRGSFGGDPTYGSNPITVSGTFTNCTGFGTNTFGAYGTASGTFTDCTAGNNSFGETASGTFTNCKGGVVSFGGSSSGLGSTASGTFTNCTAGDGSFGTVEASGTFINCTAGDGSFGTSGPASGTFTNCTGGNYSFGSPATGTFINCTAGDGSFGGGGESSGTFTNCTGGNNSFGSYETASGTFTNCTGGNNSFGGGGGTLTGKLFYCRLTAGTFQTVSDSGVTRLCLDGSNVENNQG